MHELPLDGVCLRKPVAEYTPPRARLVSNLFAATFSELRLDGLQRGRRILASGDSSRQPPPVHVGP